VARIKRSQANISGLTADLTELRNSKLDIDASRLSDVLSGALVDQAADPTPEVLPQDEITHESLNRQAAALDVKVMAITRAVSVLTQELTK
jgi:hypothetical protein